MIPNSKHPKWINCRRKTGLRLKSAFYNNANLVHDDKYLYNLSTFVSTSDEMEIICKEHGVFRQKPKSHLQGRGCSECGKALQVVAVTANAARQKKEASLSFKSKAKLVHNNNYRYNKVKYIDKMSHVIIICKKHGEFNQTPDIHLSGAGCQSCAVTGFKSSEAAVLYYYSINTVKGLLYKIGVSNYSCKERTSPIDWEFITLLMEKKFKNGRLALDEERNIKESHKKYKYTGAAILERGGDTELFTQDVLGLDI